MRVKDATVFGHGDLEVIRELATQLGQRDWRQVAERHRQINRRVRHL